MKSFFVIIYLTFFSYFNLLAGRLCFKPCFLSHPTTQRAEERAKNRVYKNHLKKERS